MNDEASALVVALASVVGMSKAVAQQRSAPTSGVQDPLIGTWELNVAKSKFTGGSAPRSEMRTYVAAGADIKATLKGIGADGKPTVGEWTVNEDGKGRPQSGSPDADAVSFKRLDAHTVEFTEKRAGKVVMTGRRSISPDGKVMTISSKGVDANGQKVEAVMVLEKR